MKLLRKKYFNPILTVLFLLNLLTRSYGIWFQRMAWDEEQYYFGGKGILRWLNNCLTGNGFSNISDDLISIYGVSGKYLSALGLAFNRLWQTVFGFGSAYDAFVWMRIFTSLIPSLISVYILYQIARKLSDSKTFYYAVLFLSAFAFRWVESAHYAVPDSLTTMSVLWVILEWISFNNKQNIRIVLRLALALALALSTKINVGLFLWGLVSVFLLYSLIKQKHRCRYFFVLQVFFILFSVIINLPYLFYLDLYIKEIRFHIFEFPFVIQGHPLIYFIFKPAMGVDWGIIVFALVSAFVLVWKKKQTKNWIPLLAWLAVFYLYLSFSRGAIARWEIPLIPVIIMLAAYSIFFIQLKIRQKFFKVLALSFALAAMCLRPAYHILQLDAGLVYKDSVWVELSNDLKSMDCNENRFTDFEIMMFTLDDFLKSDKQCALIHDHWYHDLYTNEIPANYENFIANESYIGRGSLEIRKYIRENWYKVGTYIPRFYTTWTYNQALRYPADLYLCGDCIEN